MKNYNSLKKSTIFAMTICFGALLMLVPPPAWADAKSDCEARDGVWVVNSTGAGHCFVKLEPDVPDMPPLGSTPPPPHTVYIKARPHGWIEIQTEMVALTLTSVAGGGEFFIPPTTNPTRLPFCPLEVRLDGELFLYEQIFFSRTKTGFLFPVPVGTDAQLTITFGCGITTAKKPGRARPPQAKKTVNIEEGLIYTYSIGIIEEGINVGIEINEEEVKYGINEGELLRGISKGKYPFFDIFYEKGVQGGDSFFDIIYTLGINSRKDLFFDVFTEAGFDINAPLRSSGTTGRSMTANYNVDSFFDITTDLGIKPKDSFSKALKKLGINGGDSFFDVFYKVLRKPYGIAVEEEGVTWK